MWRLTAEGVDDPPAILLIHGRTWSSAPDFDLRVGDDRSRSLAHNLAAAGYAVYGLDLRGYGQTKRDASGWLEPDRAVEDLAAATAVIREREGEAPDLLGWSNGALVAHLYAQRHAEGLGKLVLYGYPRDPDVRAAEAPKSGEPARAKTTAEAARSDFITPGTMPEAAADAFVEQALAADPVRADWRSLQQFDAIDPAALTSPTLVIHGVHDPYAKQLWMAKLFTRMKVEARQWVMLPNADHAAHLEHPEAFTRALLAFLAD
ncbi:alpha/beta fold hydrolase [Pseudenhygromyxa sp. WMMC2535]|nr:alpha/beta fold hydrolase [Pseudenhygromyxa sp. WMMC2535]